MVRAEAVARAARQVKALGFEPDIIIGHHGWGELLSLGDVWPRAPLLGYHEYYYNLHGHDVGFDPEFPVAEAHHPHIRAKNAVNHLALTNPGHGMTPTAYQLSTYPAWARPGIAVLTEGVNLQVCKPGVALRKGATVAGVRVAASETLVTFVARDLEPYRGFHILMRALPAVLRARPDARVVIVGGDGISYGSPPPRGTWRGTLIAGWGEGVDRARVHFAGRVEYAEYVRLLQRSDAHVYLTYPFVASWSLREAMACGCPHRRQRHRASAGVHHPRRDRAADAVPGPGRPRRGDPEAVGGGQSRQGHVRRRPATRRDPPPHGRLSRRL